MENTPASLGAPCMPENFKCRRGRRSNLTFFNMDQVKTSKKSHVHTEFPACKYNITGFHIGYVYRIINKKISVVILLLFGVFFYYDNIIVPNFQSLKLIKLKVFLEFITEVSVPEVLDGRHRGSANLGGEEGGRKFKIGGGKEVACVQCNCEEDSEKNGYVLF